MSDPFGLLGNTLAGHFLVESLAGEGRRSVVYKGEYLGPKEPVALKCLKVPASLDGTNADAFLTRFRDALRRETKVIRGKPHFVRSIGSGITTAAATTGPAVVPGSQVPFTVQEWLYGQSLADDVRARRARGSKGRTIQEVFALLGPAVAGLALAHAEGVPHGDLNTGNFFLAATSDGARTTVLDFAIARVANAALAEVLAAGEGANAGVLGSATLPEAPAARDAAQAALAARAAEAASQAIGLAPEQLRGEPASLPADVFALGLVVLELLRERPALSLGEVAALTTSGPTPRSLGLSVPAGFDSAVARALDRDPAKRFPTVQAFWAALEAGAPEAASEGRLRARTDERASGKGRARSSSKVKTAKLPPPSEAKPLTPPAPPPRASAPNVSASAGPGAAHATDLPGAPSPPPGRGHLDTVPDSGRAKGAPDADAQAASSVEARLPPLRAATPKSALPSIIVDGEAEEDPTQPGIPMLPSTPMKSAERPAFEAFDPGSLKRTAAPEGPPLDKVERIKRPRPPRNLPDGADRTILVPRSDRPIEKPKPTGYQSLARVAILSFVIVFLAGATAIAVHYLVQKG